MQNIKKLMDYLSKSKIAIIILRSEKYLLTTTKE
jgi:hypothetical protein